MLVGESAAAGNTAADCAGDGVLVVAPERADKGASVAAKVAVGGTPVELELAQAVGVGLLVGALVGVLVGASVGTCYKGVIFPK